MDLWLSFSVDRASEPAVWLPILRVAICTNEILISCLQFITIYIYFLKKNLNIYCWPSDKVLCVCVFSSHPFWTSMDVPAGVTQEEGHTGFLIHLPSAVRALVLTKIESI